MTNDPLIKTCAAVLTPVSEDTASDDKKYNKAKKAFDAKAAKTTDAFNAIEKEIRDLKAALKPAVKKLQADQTLLLKQSSKDKADFGKLALKLGYHFDIPGGWQRIK